MAKARWFVGLVIVGSLVGDTGMVLWSSNFEGVDIGAEPPDAMVLQGEFRVAKDGDRKILELPGAPLESMGMLVGPVRVENVSITARILGEKKGRQSPTFGVGLCGAKGYRLMVTPMRETLELMRDEEVVGRAPFKWKSGAWTRLRLRVQREEDRWSIRGKAWNDEEAEPEVWLISHTAKERPMNGAASLWGMPYSGQPIRYDAITYSNIH